MSSIKPSLPVIKNVNHYLLNLKSCIEHYNKTSATYLFLEQFIEIGNIISNEYNNCNTIFGYKRDVKPDSNLLDLKYIGSSWNIINQFEPINNLNNILHTKLFTSSFFKIMKSVIYWTTMGIDNMVNTDIVNQMIDIINKFTYPQYVVN